MILTIVLYIAIGLVVIGVSLCVAAPLIVIFQIVFAALYECWRSKESDKRELRRAAERADRGLA